MTGDAVIQCPTCKGDRVLLQANGDLVPCTSCDAYGVVAAPAFRVRRTVDALERAPSTLEVNGDR